MSQIVYLVESSYFNGCDVWEDTESIHQTRDSAENAVLLLMGQRHPDSDTEFNIKEWPLLKIDTEGKQIG